MDTIPPEIIAAILALCPDFAPAIRAVCRLWRVLAPAGGALQVRRLARDGREDFLRWVYENVGKEPSTAATRQMLCGAADGGHERLCVLAKTWGADDFNGMIWSATLGGRERLCVLAKEWGATDFNRMLSTAVLGGHERLCVLAKEWGATSFDVMLSTAAVCGDERLCILAKKWAAEAAAAGRG